MGYNNNPFRPNVPFLYKTFGFLTIARGIEMEIALPQADSGKLT